MLHRRTPARELVAIAIILSLACCATAAAGQQRAQMQVSCIVLPHISLQVNNQKPVYSNAAATLVIEQGQIQLTSTTNDSKSSEFVLTATSDASAVVNGLKVEPGQTVEVGRYSYGGPVVLKAVGGEPIRLTASRL